MNNQPIGVFDSGLGGLTLVRELHRVLPHEDIVYFGDTGRVPYGSRSSETITKYAREAVAFLREQDVKMILAACGTVSSICGELLKAELPLPFSGVVEHGARAAASATKTGRIGVIGTPATVRSGAYGKKIKSIRSDAVIAGKACPLFVPLVENGYLADDNPVTRQVAQDYLGFFRDERIDTLILGCTHYPLLSGVISEVVGAEVTLIDVGRETARYAASQLLEQGLLCGDAQKGKAVYYVSDDVYNFGELASRLLQQEVSEDVHLVDLERFARV